MLAESRRRRKNPMHSINLSAPNHWTNDESKFGQKMLEKMGWTKGSGLGKNNQGIAENIRVQHKVTPTGLGFVAHDANDWFKAGEDYARLLSQLAENYDCPLITESDVNNKKSLVENSLNSRSRVHYHKFTRGKDLTKYKNEELACIIGKGKKEEVESKFLNMKEYFKTKRQSKILNGVYDKNENVSVEINEHEVSECEGNCDQKKRKSKHKILLEASDDVHLDKNQEIPSFNKKRKLEQEITSDEKTQLLDDANLGLYKKSKSKKKKAENNSLKVEFATDEHDSRNNKDTSDINNSADNRNNSNISVSNINNEIEIGSKKKKSKSKFKNEILTNTNSNVESSVISNSVIKDDSDIKSIQNEEPIINNNSDNYSSEENMGKLTKLNFTDKYQFLVNLMIENSSAGKKFCKNTPPEFYTEIENFMEKVKEEPGSINVLTNVHQEIKSSKKKLLEEGKLNNLNPDDENFINDFEAQKSKLLKKKLTLQQNSKSISDKAMFVAKYSDILFFGSNINEIKGYGEF